MTESRILKLRKACAREGVGAFLVRDTASIRWLTGFDGVFDDERAHALVVTCDKAVLHTDSRYAQAARRAAQVAGGEIEVDDSRTSHARFAAGLMEPQRIRAAASAVSISDSDPECVESEAGASSGDSGSPGASGGAFSDIAAASASPFAVLGIEDDISLREYRALVEAMEDAAGANEPVRLHETDCFVRQLRAVKDADEVARLRAAQAVTDAAFRHIVGFMRPGMTEREVQIELDDYMRRHGADDLAFPSIVACGQNGASPHAVPGNTRLEAGQCVVMDFGAKAQGYCADMTRTVFLGQPTERMRAAYGAIRQANEQVEALLAPGVTGAEAQKLAEDILADAGFAGAMGHALGHGVGLEIHEEPVLALRNGKGLQVGNVVTVEPGIYLPGEFGMRLEDFGVITENGFEVFTKSSHDMVIL